MQVKVEYSKAVHIVLAMLEPVLLLLCPPLQRNLVLVVRGQSIKKPNFFFFNLLL